MDMEGRFVTVQKTRLVTRCAYCNSENSYNKNGLCKNCGANEQTQQEETYLAKEYSYCSLSETLPEKVDIKKDDKEYSIDYTKDDKIKAFILAILISIVIIAVIVLIAISVSPKFAKSSKIVDSWAINTNVVYTSCKNCGEHIVDSHPQYGYYDYEDNLILVSEDYGEVVNYLRELDGNIDGTLNHQIMIVIHCENCNHDTIIKD